MFREPPYSEHGANAESFADERIPGHARAEGFGITIARSDAHEPLGFAYAVTGRAGSWWHGYLSERVDPALVDAWLPGACELVEFAVSPRARGRGLGRALLETLLDSRSEARVIGQTLDLNTPARRLYRRMGMRDLARFDGQVLFGRELPRDPVVVP